MLKRIRIQNLALVEDVDLEFHKGLNVLTGETGAGKSVIVNALSLALGERADREYIRFRADSAVVEADFDVSRLPAEYRRQYAAYIDNNTIFVVREIARDGNSKVRIAGANATLAVLKELMAPVAEILGQHANQMLMNEDNHLDFLDHFASLDTLKSIVAEKYCTWKASLDELARLRRKRDQIVQEQELLIFQKNEIEKAQIHAGEEEDLLREKRILDSARTLMGHASMIQDLIDGEENSVMSLLSLVEKELDKMSEVDASLQKQGESVTEVIYRLQDIRSFIEQYGSSIEDDPERIEEINARLDEIYKLKKKYGGSEEAIMRTLTSIKAKLAASPPDIDIYIDELTSKHDIQYQEFSEVALSLTDTRRKAADYLQKLVVKELAELAITAGGFEFEFLYEDDPGGVMLGDQRVKPSENGLETGRILFSANPGEPLKSLVKTASGGEISRVLLALKSAEKKNHKLLHPLLVFDEVDAGIGGQTAVEVGKKLKRLSSDSQLLVITHLHQIARQADHHYVAEKTSHGRSRTTIQVRSLDQEDIEKELARMVALPK